MFITNYNQQVAVFSKQMLLFKSNILYSENSLWYSLCWFFLYFGGRPILKTSNELDVRDLHMRHMKTCLYAYTHTP